MEIGWPLADQTAELAVDEAHVWAVALDQAPSIEECEKALSPEERHRAERFRTDLLQRRFCVGRAALRELLSRYLSVAPADVELSATANGKPYLAPKHAGAELRFNLAHSHELAIIAVTSGVEIGVDVERLRTVAHAAQIARRYFHEAEAEQILTAAPAVRDEIFLRCWTAKEAILKATGLGLMGSLTTFQVPITEHDVRWIDLPRESSAAMPKRLWLEPLRPANEYVGAIAFAGAKRRLRCFTMRV